MIEFHRRGLMQKEVLDDDMDVVSCLERVNMALIALPRTKRYPLCLAGCTLCGSE
jgi:hypothetical protein